MESKGDTMSTESKCCFLTCPLPATFTIYGQSDHPEDVTEACEDHVGSLLGTPDYLERDNISWRVVHVGRS